MPAAVAVPLVAGGLGLAGSALQNRATEKAVRNQAQQYNGWLDDRSNSVDALLRRLQDNGINPFGPQTNTGTSNSTSATSFDQTSNPFITSDYKGLEGGLKGVIEGRLAAPSSLPPGYAESAIRGINKSYAGADASARNLAASRGLGGAQSYALATPATTERAGKTADLLASLPLQERQMQNEDLAMAQGLIDAFGKGTQSRGRSTTSTSGTNTMTSGPNISELANLLLPPGPNASTQTGISTTGAGMGDLSRILMGLYAANPNMFGGGGGRGGAQPYNTVAPSADELAYMLGR